MSICELEEKDWDTLIQTIRDEDCILMLGPDAAVPEKGGKNKPLMKILADVLANEIKNPDNKKKVKHCDLPMIAKFYKMETGRTDLTRIVRDFYKERENLNSRFHRDLAALPFSLIITTTPDNMFRNALVEEKKVPRIGYYHYKGKAAEIEKGSIEKPLLFYLYGALNDSHSLLLTENDLLDFLVAIISGNPPLPDNICSELHSPAKSFLFLGFGIQNWHLRILLHVLGASGKESRSFAMEDFNNINELNNRVLFFMENNFKVHIFKCELKKFARELKKRFQEIQPLPTTRAEVKSRLSPAPKIFICHADKDKDTAVEIYTKLKRVGFNPWLDKEDIDPGVDWNLEIKATLNNVDYFIVLQSEALNSGEKRYFLREIQIALDCRKELPPRSSFIIPIRIEDCDYREELQKFNGIDYFNQKDEGMNRLISFIRKDYQRRQR